MSRDTATETRDGLMSADQARKLKWLTALPETVTASGTLNAGDNVDIDTTGGAITQSLPADPQKGDWVLLAWSAGETAPVIGRNGSTIEGGSEDETIDMKNARFRFYFDGATWRIEGWSAA